MRPKTPYKDTVIVRFQLAPAYTAVISSASQNACQTPVGPMIRLSTNAIGIIITVDGVAEKESMVVTDADPTVTVCVYSVKSDKSGLKQNMDGIDGDELDAQELLDKMAEMGVIEEGITVDKFEQKDGALTLDLSSLKESSDKLVVMAIANTFIQNYEAKTLELSVAGEKIGDGPMSFEKNYKKVN